MQHVRAAAGDGRFSIVAAAESAPRFDADLPGGATILRDWHALIDPRRLDAVSICLPHHLHPEVTEAALQAGMHVLLEKPLAATIEDARRIANAAADNRRPILMIEMTHRFYPPIVQAQRMLRSGEVG